MTAVRPTTPARLWIERLVLTGFRNHAETVLKAAPGPIVLTGANGSGKTNILEAVSLLSPGQGLRRVPFVDLSQVPGNGTWVISARVKSGGDVIDIGTGQTATAETTERSGRQVRIGGETSTSAALADHIDMVWLTPASDGLFTGPASDRRRFLDRLILCFDPAHGKLSSRFERAMQQRNRLLNDGVMAPSQFEGLETVMAETAIAIAAARNEAITALAGVIAERRTREPGSAFPWSTVAVEGALEAALEISTALDVEDNYRSNLARLRERDRAAGRTLDGPHRSDLVVGHGPKSMPARLSSTGEQKALLLGLVLAHAELIGGRGRLGAPILLLDEVTAHLDAARRTALFDEILRLGSQVWMTGTDREWFAELGSEATFFTIHDGHADATPAGPVPVS